MPNFKGEIMTCREVRHTNDNNKTLTATKAY